MIPVNIIQRLQSTNLLKMRTVSEVMQKKIIFASPTTSLLNIAQTMAAKKISSVAIATSTASLSNYQGADNAQQQVEGLIFPVGIIVERDIKQFQALELDLSKIEAKKVMSTDFFCVASSDSLYDAYREMQRRNLQQLIVTGDVGELVGIVNQTSFLQLFDPWEIATAIASLEQKLKEKTARLIQVEKQLKNEIAQPQQTSTNLEQQVAQATAELFQVNKQLKASLEEQAVFEEELRQQNEELSIANENAKLQQQRYEDLFEFAPDAYLITDVNGKIQEANRAACILFGVSLKYPIGKPIFVFIDPAQRKVFRILVNSSQSVQDWEFSIERPEGMPFYGTITMTSIHDFQGKLVGKRLMIRDITERKQAEEKIKQQAALLDITADAIIVCNLNKQILFWNRGAENLYEWLQAEATSQNIQELFDQNNSPQFRAAFDRVLIGSWQGELQQVTKSGKEIVVHSRWTLMHDQQNNPKSILIVNTDISEKKQLETQYYRAQRLESLGTLASGIAHDLNNILTPILTGTQLLQLKLPHLDERNQLLLKMLEDNSKRGAQLVKQITSFAKGTQGHYTNIQLAHLINEIHSIVESTFPVGIEFSTAISTELWTVEAQASQIHQLLINLCINARDAMPEGGTLSITAENRHIDRNDSSMNPEAKVGDYVAIAVSDTGCGIPQEILKQIFKPFFTTKQVGKGTGLGLSTAIAIVKSHGGFIQVSSQVDRGSQFQVYLPASHNQEIKQTTVSQISDGNGELILVVDDEEYVREITKNSLESHNYRIFAAKDGFEAFSFYVKCKQEISLVLIDIQMPSIDGLKVIQVLQRINPDVKIIAISGLSTNRQLLEENDIKVNAFLSKPYTLGELLELIKTAIKGEQVMG